MIVTPLVLRPSSHGNVIVPFHLRTQSFCSPLNSLFVRSRNWANFWNGQIGCSKGNRTIAYEFCFVFRRGQNRSVDIFSIGPFRRERNGTIAHRSSSRFTYLVDLFFGTERFYLKCSRLKATLQRFTFRNDCVFT